MIFHHILGFTVSTDKLRNAQKTKLVSPHPRNIVVVVVKAVLVVEELVEEVVVIIVVVKVVVVEEEK